MAIERKRDSTRPMQEPRCEATGKVRFPTEKAALQAVRRMRSQNLRAANGTHPYHCKACRRWHVGHNLGGEGDGR